MDDSFGEPAWVHAVPYFIGAVALLMLLLFVWGIGRALLLWSRNNAAPVLTVPATVVSRRGHRSSGTQDTGPTTSYFVTFEVPTGDRLEFGLSGQQYGQLVERDRGELTYQGTRYRGFVRAPQDS